MNHALKFVDGSDEMIEGMLAPHGGIFNGRDFQGEYFSNKTDFVLDLFEARPLMFHHGLDPMVDVAAVGRIKSLDHTEKGLWMQAWLDKRSEYYDAIKQMIGEKALELSSGGVSHLVRIAKSGEILRWPVFEGSLTATPACPGLASVDFAKAITHFKSAGIDVDVDALKAKMDTSERGGLPDSDSTSSDSNGGRHLPVNDEAHTRETVKLGVDAGGTDVVAKPAASSTSASVKSMEGSYEDLIEDLSALLNPQTPFGPEYYTSIVATFPGTVIACRYDYGCDPDEDATTYWRVAYTVDSESGEPTLGTATQVEQTYVPAKSYVSDSPIALDATILGRHAGALAQRTEDLRDRRIKEGRALSTANRSKLSDAVTTLDAAKSVIQALLDASDQLARSQAEAKALLEPDALQRRLAALSLFVGE